MTKSESHLESRSLVLKLWSSWLLSNSIFQMTNFLFQTFQVPKALILNTTRGPYPWQSSAVCLILNSSRGPLNSYGVFVFWRCIWDHQRTSDQDLQETLLDTSKTWLKEVAGDNTYNSWHTKQSLTCRKPSFASFPLAGGVQHPREPQLTMEVQEHSAQKYSRWLLELHHSMGKQPRFVGLQILFGDSKSQYSNLFFSVVLFGLFFFWFVCFGIFWGEGCYRKLRSS